MKNGPRLLTQGNSANQLSERKHISSPVLQWIRRVCWSIWMHLSPKAWELKMYLYAKRRFHL